MKTRFSLAACAVFATAALASGIAAAGNVRIGLAFNGLAVANTSAPPQTAAFGDWCASTCTPTVQQPVYDTNTGRRAGSIYVWARFPFEAGTIIPSSFCFSEFIVFELTAGDIHVKSGPNGTCGATMDPVLKPPKHADLGALSVIAGGGDGVIVGGTRLYRRLTGTFTDRVFVGFGMPTSGVGGIVYYDQLIFTITGD